jgi:Putative peptidoglycan binding domain
MRRQHPLPRHSGCLRLGAVSSIAVIVGLAGTLAAAAEVATPAPGTPIAVSYADLPPALNLEPYAVVDVAVDTELEVGTNVPAAAVLSDGGVILVDERSSSAFLVGRDGSASAVTLDVVPQFIVATPGPVVYGLAEAGGGGLEFVAVSLVGANAGHVVARRPVADPGQYLELPLGAFGNTADGVVDRVRQPGAVMIAHVDASGSPVTVAAGPLWQIGGGNVVTNGSRQWTLAIERHPAWAPQFAGESPPAPTSNGGGVYWTFLGPPIEGTEFSQTMPVVAVLGADGTGAWHTVPTGWQAVASDVGGTVFARRVGDTVELARLDEALANARVCDEYTDNDDYPLRRCDSGPAVTVVQMALRSTVAPALEVDGYFGPRTEAAVREFQRSAGLAVDGLVGPRTWPALTATYVYGRDEDGSGVVDPWELDPTPEVAGFPEDSPPSCQGCEIWAVILAAAPAVDDPALLAAVDAAHAVGYATGQTGCDEGAAAAAGAPPGSVTVSVYFATEADARAARAAFAERGVSSTVALVRTYCLD